MHFRALVRGTLDEAKSGLLDNLKEQVCNDQYVGRISELIGQKDFRQRDPVCERPSNIPCLILVLESPHRDEFAGTPGPAKGSTGRQIRRYLLQVKGLESLSDHGLILVNAVQYQCSLGMPTRCFRDRVFSAVWSGGGQEDFESRLLDYWRPKDVIANCCTKGSARLADAELRVMVHDLILRALPDTEPLRRTHPYSWIEEKHRKDEWEYTPMAER